MPEYLIRTDSGEWPPVHRDRLAAVLLAPADQCEQVEGCGEFRMRCGNAVLAFSGEESGWQVAVEGVVSEDESDRLISEATERISAEVGQPCTWLCIA